MALCSIWVLTMCWRPVRRRGGRGEDREVVGLGGAAGEDHFVGLGGDDVGDLAPGVLDSGLAVWPYWWVRLPALRIPRRGSADLGGDARV